MMDNPFQFERENKKFINTLEHNRNIVEEEDDHQQITRLTQLYMGKGATRYGLLRKLEEQTDKLAQERDIIFSMKSQSFNPKPDPIAHHLKQFNPLMVSKNYDDFKAKPRVSIREKKETLIDFVQKKREICITNLNIITKKEETNRLEDFIKNEQESLKARKLYFKNDCELVKRFMNEVKAQADQSSIQADRETRRKEEVKVEVARILAQIDRLKLQKSKLLDEFERLDKYRLFQEKIKKHYKTKFTELEKQSIDITQIQNIKKTLFLTGVNIMEKDNEEMQKIEQQLIEEQQQNRMANAVIEILDAIEEGNLRNMQNQRDAEEEIESKRREAEQMSLLLKKNQQINEERIKTLEKQFSLCQQQYQVLIKQGKVDKTKLQFAEGEDLDMDKIGKRIIEIFQEVGKKEDIPQKKISYDSKTLKLYMNLLEKIVLELSEYKVMFLLKNKQEYLEAEKRIKQQKKELRQTNQKDEEKKKQILERRLKKEQYMENFYQGRKDMRRNYPEEKIVIQEIKNNNDDNDDDKYLLEDYELVNCMDMMDIMSIGSNTTPINNTLHKQSRNNSVSNLKRTITSSNRPSRQSSHQSSQQKSNTQQSNQHDIAYKEQLRKKSSKHRSSDSISSASSLDQSFKQMEKRMKKFQQTNPELIDQKYMVSGFVQMSKDFKNLLLLIKAFRQNLIALVTQPNKQSEILRVDKFFIDNSQLLESKVKDYYKIKECLYRFLRMGIQEPYYQRVKKVLSILEKHNNQMQLFSTYLNIFDFIQIKAFNFFKEDIKQMRELEKPPVSEEFGQLFDIKIQEINHQLKISKEDQLGDTLSQIFDVKIQQILQWKYLIVKIMQFTYVFNIKYLLDTESKLRKIIKSRKLYDQISGLNKDIENFMVDNYAMNNIYLTQIVDLQDDLNILQQQVIKWNIQLQQEKLCQLILELVKLNIKQKKINKHLENILEIKSAGQLPEKYEASATDIIIKSVLQQKQIQNVLQTIQNGQEIKEDEYIQKQFNKYILLQGQFNELKTEFDI